MPQSYTPRSPWHSWAMIFCSALFYAFQYIVRMAPAVMTDELSLELHVDATQLGILSSLFYYAYAPALIPLGLAMDRLGVKRLIPAAAGLCAVGCLLFTASTSLMTACLARFCMGLGAAGAFLGTLKLGTVILPVEQLTKVVAITMLSGTMGAVLSGSPLEWTLQLMGWRETMLIIGISGVILAGFLLFSLRHLPDPKAQNTSILAGLKRVMCSGESWILALYGMLMYMPLPVIGDLWGISFLERMYPIQEIVAATFIGCMFVGVSIGSPVFAAISDKMRSRKWPMVFGAAGNLLIFIIIIWVPISPSLMYLMFFFAGFCFSSKTLCFPSICECFSPKDSGAAISFVNTNIMLSGVIGLPLAGWLLDRSQKSNSSVEALSNSISSMSQYTLEDFQYALALIPAGLAVALALSLFLKETFQRPTVEEEVDGFRPQDQQQP
ncbi:MAG: MFS transporter [Oligoflexales bacterium]